jgi:hypothetical protein
MRYLKSYKIFESNSNILEYISILTDNQPEIIYESKLIELQRKYKQ